jgi:hypothetical protein
VELTIFIQKERSQKKSYKKEAKNLALKTQMFNFHRAIQAYNTLTPPKEKGRTAEDVTLHL